MPRIDHDGAFRLVFSDPRVLADFLVGFVGSRLGELLDLSTLKQVAARHVSEGLHQSENDMIWEVRTRQGEVIYVYVMLEFQSRADWTMALRMLNYVGQFYRRLASQKDVRSRQRLPRVLAVVLYNGEPEWRAARNMHELIEGELPGFEEHSLGMGYALVDVWRSPGLERGLRNLADAVFRLQRVESLGAGRREVRQLVEWLDAEDWADLRRALSAWIMKALLPSRLPGVSIPEAEDLRQVDAVLEAGMTTWSEQFKSEGRAEGQIGLLVSMARQRFGEASASTMAALLGSVKSEAALDDVGKWLLSCKSGDALIAKIREI